MNIDYIKRDIYEDMLKWKNSLRFMKTTLEVKGSCQVGKTFIVKKFAEENFEKVYYINLFDRDSRMLVEQVIANNYRTLDTIKCFFPNFVDSSNSIIIIDEIQEYANTYNLIKPVALELKTQMIATGSFLGRVIMKKDYFLVGAERTPLMLRSLSFPEFLGIFNSGERELYNSISLYGESHPDEYERLKKLYNLYLTLGGYPAVIKKALETGKLNDGLAEIEEIVDIFFGESRRYMDDITDFDYLPKLMNKVADFILADNRGTMRFYDELQKIDYGSGTVKKSVERALSWLAMSGLIAPCSRSVDLDPRGELLSARYYFTDLGLANYLFKQTKIHQSNRIGRLAENFIFRCLLD